MFIKTLFISALILIIALYSYKVLAKPEQFIFITEDIFQLSDGRLVVSGQVKTGKIQINEKLVTKIDGIDKSISIQEMQVFGKKTSTDIAVKGDYVAFTISGIAKEKINKGTVFLKEW